MPKEGLSIINFVSTLINFILVYSFPFLTDTDLKMSGYFIMLTSFNIINFIIVYYYLLETKGLNAQ